MLIHSAGQRHFLFSQVARCSWADGETAEKKNQPGSSVSCELSENIERFRVNEVSRQILQPIEFVRSRVNEAFSKEGRWVRFEVRFSDTGPSDSPKENSGENVI